MSLCDLNTYLKLIVIICIILFYSVIYNIIYHLNKEEYNKLDDTKKDDYKWSFAGIDPSQNYAWPTFLYMSSTTFSSVGFGDYYPIKSGAKWVVLSQQFFMILIGLAF